MPGIKGKFAKSYDKFVSRKSLLPPGLIKLVSSIGPANVLEFGCGTGSVLVGLSFAGYKVTGVDLSAEMLRSAHEKAGRFGVEAKFIKADITDIDLKQNYDLLLCLGNTVPLIYRMKDARKLFHNFTRHLRPGGTLIIQQLNYDRILKNRPKTFAVDRSESHIRIKQYKYERSLIDFAVTLVDHSKIPPAVDISRSKIRPWKKRELAVELSAVGFEKIRGFGDYNGNRFNLKSKDLILVATLS